MLKLIALFIVLFPLWVHSHCDPNKKIIPLNLLGSELHVYQASGTKFKRIIPDLEWEYELPSGEYRYLIIDNNHNYFSLKTKDGIIVELFIRNPIFITERGASVGDPLNKVKKLYPKAYFIEEVTVDP